ncbi:hypothetical protein PIB30_099976 [Stylosanthes scabra]|uniref:Uncharacterized protein n=1 Tax=Stylosanthes scabra TaxID=79078 RepID=A0ABU6UZF9_9FABA|nr:hypothetical protein [Stylosanthes scabra]
MKSLLSFEPPLLCQSWAMMNRKREKLTTPPTRKSQRLAGMPPSPPPIPSRPMSKLVKFVVLALAASTLNSRSKAIGNTQVPGMEEPKIAKAKKFAQI